MSPSRRNCLLPEETNVPEMKIKLEAFDVYNQVLSKIDRGVYYLEKIIPPILKINFVYLKLSIFELSVKIFIIK